MSGQKEGDRPAELISEERIDEVEGTCLGALKWGSSATVGTVALASLIAAARRAHELEREAQIEHDRSLEVEGGLLDELGRLNEALAAEKRARAAEVEAAFKAGARAWAAMDRCVPRPAMLDAAWRVFDGQAESDARAALASAPAEPSESGWTDIVFDGPPGPEAGRFVEVENAERASVSVGTWVERDDGYWALRIAVPPSQLQAASAPAEDAPALAIGVDFGCPEGDESMVEVPREAALQIKDDRASALAYALEPAEDAGAARLELEPCAWYWVRFPDSTFDEVAYRNPSGLWIGLGGPARSKAEVDDLGMQVVKPVGAISGAARLERAEALLRGLHRSCGQWEKWSDKVRAFLDADGEEVTRG